MTVLSARLLQVSAEFGRVLSAVENFRAVLTAASSVFGVSSRLPLQSPETPPPCLSAIEELRGEIEVLKSLFTSTGFASLIVANFPALFAEFRGKRFTLLWRGSRDGFGAEDFHRRCDGRGRTLTLIEDTEGNVFGGFTPVEWESRKWDGAASTALGRHNCLKADPSQKSFVFTLKNPRNFPAKKFGLKAEKKDEAIFCDSECGPYFCDICVSDHCNANARSHTFCFGRSYANDTRLDGRTFLTGSDDFTVKEIEVFEIAE
jgi:hypothetical protein